MPDKDKIITKRAVIRLSPQGALTETDIVAVEYQFELFVNARSVFKFDCSPKQLKELVTGFLLDEGFIERLDEIKCLEFKPSSCTVNLKTHKKRSLAPVRPLKMASWPSLWNLMEKFGQRSLFFKQTGCFHAAAVATERDIFCFAEDIGRHNAIDKVIGTAILKNISLEDKILLTSCRISSSIIKKAIFAGIPTIASKSAVTEEAVKLALQYNIGLIGFIRSHKMNIYTGWAGIKNT